VLHQQEVIHQLREQERSLRAQCGELRNSLEAALDEQAAARAQLSAAKCALSQLACKHEEEQEALRAIREERAAEQRRLGDARRALSQVEAAVEELQQEEDLVAGRVADLQAHLQCLQQERSAGHIHPAPPQPGGVTASQGPQTPAPDVELALLRAELEAVRARAEAAELKATQAAYHKDKTALQEHSASLDLTSIQQQLQALVQQVAQRASLTTSSSANLVHQEQAAAGALQQQVSALQGVLGDTLTALSAAQEELVNKQAALAAVEQQESQAHSLLASLRGQQAQALEELAAVRQQVQAAASALTSLVAAGAAAVPDLPAETKPQEGGKALSEAANNRNESPPSPVVLQDLQDQLMHLMLQSAAWREVEARLRAELDSGREAAAAADARAQGAEQEAGARLAQVGGLGCAP
jgi:chromosome segregation ATPase